MDIQQSDPIEQFAIGQTPFSNTLHAVTYLAAGNSDVVTKADLGGINYNETLKSSVEPIFGKSVSNTNEVMTGLLIHNPDNSEIVVDMSQYQDNRNGVSTTKELRHALYEAYQREASTESGTSTFTQNAQYFRQVTWLSPHELDVSSNSPDVEQSLIRGELSGSMLNRSPEEQSALIYRQHDAMQESVNKALLHLNQNELTAPKDTQNAQTTLKDILNADVSPSQHAEVLALVYERQHSMKEESLAEIDKQNDINR